VPLTLTLKRHQAQAKAQIQAQAGAGAVEAPQVVPGWRPWGLGRQQRPS
jgi:hypothetical protein